MAVQSAANESIPDGIRRRLGNRFLVRVPDVAAACDVSPKTVIDWIHDGSIEGLNIGRGQRTRWQVKTNSVVAFYERQKEAM